MELGYNRAMDAASTEVTESEPIDSDLKCIKCDYNLRGLHVAGRCPECGKWIKETIEERSLDRKRPSAVPLLVGIASFILLICGVIYSLFSEILWYTENFLKMD
jgi:hypothetical protein